MHVDQATLDLETTLRQSRNFIKEMLWVRLSLDFMDDILASLEGHSLSFVKIEENGQGCSHSPKIGIVHTTQSSVWAASLKSQIKFIRYRINDLIEFQRATEAMVRIAWPPYPSLVRGDRRLRV